MTHPPDKPQLKGGISLREFFSLGFGTIIGVGWVIVLGEWLDQAGPLGAILAFASGGVVMMCVGLCYAGVAAALPASGGEVVYAYEMFGVKASYATGWALALVYAAFTAFEAVSFGWILETLFPNIGGRVLYLSAGEPVKLGTLILGVGGMLLLTRLNYLGAKAAARFQDFLTLGLISASAVFMAVGISDGKLANLEPFFQRNESGSLWVGFLAVFVTTPVWFGGFNVIPQLMEEKAAGTSAKSVGRVIVFSVVLAAAFYCLVILSSSMVAPWKSLVRAELPAAAAFRAAFSSPWLANLVLVAALLGIVTTWNAVFMAATRVLFALGRARILPPTFGSIHPRFRSPAMAILFVGLIGCVGTFLGRSAIVPIVNVGSTCFSFAFFMTCFGLINARRKHPAAPQPYRITGGVVTVATAILGCLLMFFVSLYQPYVGAEGKLPLEWVVLAAWGLLGVLFWVLGARFRNSIGEQERRSLMMSGVVQGEEA